MDFEKRLNKAMEQPTESGASEIYFVFDYIADHLTLVTFGPLDTIKNNIGTLYPSHVLVTAPHAGNIMSIDKPGSNVDVVPEKEIQSYFSNLARS